MADANVIPLDISGIFSFCYVKLMVNDVQARRKTAAKRLKQSLLVVRYFDYAPPIEESDNFSNHSKRTGNVRVETLKKILGSGVTTQSDPRRPEISLTITLVNNAIVVFFVKRCDLLFQFLLL